MKEGGRKKRYWRGQSSSFLCPGRMMNPESEAREHHPCAVCGKPSISLCSKCRSVHYCGRQHQKEDWSAGHKSRCGPAYQVAESPEEGRFLVASRLIQAGQVILHEEPLVVGLKLASPPICLGCYGPIPVDGSVYRCSKCRWPMCSKSCEDSGLHHRSGECRLFNPDLVGRLRPEAHPQMYQCISALRCLALQDRRKLDTLMAHQESRAGTDIYRLIDCNVVRFIRQGLQLGQFDPEDIQRVSGIMDTNCFDIRTGNRPSGIRGLYQTAALMNHDCVPNTRHVFQPDGTFRIKVLATVDIRPGEKISVTYTQSLWNTFSRRAHLNSVKHFWCRCRRCSDPTELGTMMSSLICDRCGAGSALSTDPLNQNAEWKCTKCSAALRNPQARHESIRKELKELVPQARLRPQLMEDFVRKYSANPSSCHVVEAKYALVQLLGNSSDLTYEGASDEEIERKCDYCRQLLHLADVIQPGLSQFRGQLLFELQAAMEHRARRRFRKDPAQFKEAMKDVVSTFSSASEILRLEPHWIPTLEERRRALSD